MLMLMPVPCGSTLLGLICLLDFPCTLFVCCRVCVQLECPIDPVPRAELSQILARVAWRGRERARVQIVGIPRDLPVYAPQQLEMREHLDEVPQSIAKPFRFAGAVALGQYFEGAGSRRGLGSARERTLILSASHTLTEHEPRDRWRVRARLQ